MININFANFKKSQKIIKTYFTFFNYLLFFKIIIESCISIFKYKLTNEIEGENVNGKNETDGSWWTGKV